MYMTKRVGLFALLVLAVVALAACQNNAAQDGDFKITVEVDGEQLVYRYNNRISVGQFLEEIGVTLDEDDEVNPLMQTQVRDNMVITVTRVEVRQECENEPLPYETDEFPTQNLPPGQKEILQTGENGTVQVCYRIIERNGVPGPRTEINRVAIKAPRNEQYYVGVEPPDTLIPIEGVLAYISSGQAMIVEGNTANRSPLTEGGYLDGRVFDLSPDGRQLLYTRSTPDEADPDFSNELWVNLDTTSSFPREIQLIPENVRVAQWVRPNTISYSTANPTTDGAGWRAFNDLYVIQLDPDSGEMLPGTFEEIISSNALGSYAYWGRRLRWSPDGTQLAWANADSLGLVDLDTGDFSTLMSFSEYAPLLESFQGAAIWIPTLSWAEDGHLVTPMHGEPYADEAPEDSIIFDLAVLDVNTGLQLKTFIPQTGIWSAPAYSPIVEGPDGNLTYYIAYFKARDPRNSPGTEYDLWVADRDGSNERRVFPSSADLPGLRAPDPEDGIAWSPNARQIAVIHQKNLWIIDLKTGQAIPITSDGQASRPRWSRTR
jgi:hypothetical protein